MPAARAIGADTPLPSLELGTDLIAHVFGFLIGAALGVFIALPRPSAVLSHVPQWISGAFTLAVIAVSWSLALVSGGA